jgi:hypothetical protein
MNCPVLRRRLLAREQLDRLDVKAEAHLASCPTCRAWHRRLLALERNLACLPVPPSTARVRLLAQVLAAPVPALPPPLPTLTPAVERPSPQLATSAARRLNPWEASPRERARQKLALAFAIAATLLVFAFGFWAWPWRGGNPVEPPSPFAELEQTRDRLLASSRTPEERVRSLAKMADDLRREARLLARSSDVDRLAVLSRFYGQLVRDDLLTQARALPAQVRNEVVTIIRLQLTDSESDLRRWVTDNRLRAEAVGHLEEIAVASRDSNAKLGALLNEAV